MEVSRLVVRLAAVGEALDEVICLYAQTQMKLRFGVRTGRWCTCGAWLPPQDEWTHMEDSPARQPLPRAEGEAAGRLLMQLLTNATSTSEPLQVGTMGSSTLSRPHHGQRARTRRASGEDGDMGSRGRWQQTVGILERNAKLDQSAGSLFGRWGRRCLRQGFEALRLPHFLDSVMDFRRNLAAKRLQRYVRRSLLLPNLAAKRIQQCFRRWTLQPSRPMLAGNVPSEPRRVAKRQRRRARAAAKAAADAADDLALDESIRLTQRAAIDECNDAQNTAAEHESDCAASFAGVWEWRDADELLTISPDLSRLTGCDGDSIEFTITGRSLAVRIGGKLMVGNCTGPNIVFGSGDVWFRRTCNEPHVR